MMSIGQVGPAGKAGDYYTHQDNYYVLGSMDERWVGQGAEALGLSGQVKLADFVSVLEGRLPDGGDLSRMKDGRNAHRPGYDLTFSAPKSVSIMALPGGDKRLVAAHNHAVEVALREVEKLASTRSMTAGVSETKLTGNLVVAMFNHDTSRDLDPQLHTHAVVANATQHAGKWQTLSSDTVGKTGFVEALYANQVAFGQIYRHVLRQDVEAMGYPVQSVGPHGMWEFQGMEAVIDAFSKRRHSIRDAVGEDASLKSRDVATLDTRKAKVASDPATLVSPAPTPLQAGGEAAVDEAVSRAISALSDRQVNFTHTALLNKTLSYLAGEPTILDAVRAGIDRAVAHDRLIPLDREKGVFTSDIHLLDELSVAQLSRSHLNAGAVTVSPGRNGLPVVDAYSDAVSQLAQARPTLAVLSGVGGASVNRARVEEVVTMARAQGREARVLTADRTSQAYLQQANELGEGAVLTRPSLVSEALFAPNSTLVVDQAEKLTLKETVTLLDGALRNNVQLVLMDTEKRKGTGNALAVMKDAGVPRYQFSGRPTVRTLVASEPDKTARFAQLAGSYAQAVSEGIPAVAQVSGPADQRQLTGVVRAALKEAGLLGREEQTMAVLTPVWLDSKNRSASDTYREGHVMERWDPAQKQRERFVIERVGVKTRTLVLRDAAGQTHPLTLRDIDKDWSLFRAGTIAVAEGERLRVLGQAGRGKDALKAGSTLTVQRVSDGELRVCQAGGPDAAKPQRLAIGTTAFEAIKVAPAYVESLGASVSDQAVVYAAVKKSELNSETLSGIARSGKQVNLYSALDTRKTLEKVAQHPAYRLVGEQLTALAGTDSLDDALTRQKAALFTPAQQAIHLAIPTLEGEAVAFSQSRLLAGALAFADKGVGINALQGEIDAQVKRGELLSIAVAPGVGVDMQVSRASFEAEKSIIRRIAEGKDSLPPVTSTFVPGDNSGPGVARAAPELTPGQRQAVELVLTTRDRFVSIQGYAGVGKATQFRAVLAGIHALPVAQQPRVIGLAPTHRAVGEMQSAGVEAQTLASFLHDAGRRLVAGETPDYRNTLFLVDESSMIGNSDMAKTYALIAEGGGRAVMSGDEAQLQPIAPGTPFRLVQGRSAIDMAVMKEIVRQTPALKPAVYKMIDNDIAGALHVVKSVPPTTVPRREGAWVPAGSVVDYSIQKNDGNEGQKHAQQNASGGRPAATAQRPEPITPDTPPDLHTAIVRDYLGRTESARRNTLIITHLNDDRRRINAAIHEARYAVGELTGESTRLTILESATIRDGELRKLETWSRNREAVVLLDNTYYRVDEIDKANRTVTLRDGEGDTRLFSPKDAVREGVTLYHERAIDVAVGDRMRFLTSDVERGHVANSTWTVQAIEGDIVTLTDGKQTRTVNPREQQQDRHVDLAYAITAHGAQGASERFAITLEGVEGRREQMVNRASAYVALSRAKEHVQVYTDDEAGWLKAIGKVKARTTAHDAVLGMAPGSEKDAVWQASPLDGTALGRSVLRGSRLSGNTLAHFVAPGKKYPQPHAILPAYDANGKPAGAWLARLMDAQGKSLAGLPDQGRVLGSERAQFVALQASANQETRLATSMKAGIALAARYPHSGVVVRLQRDGLPFNPQAMTGGRLWVDDATVQAVARPQEPPLTLPATPEEKQQRALQEQIERQARHPASPRQLDALSDEQLLRLLQTGELRPETVWDRLPDALVREALAPMRQQDAAIQQVARESAASRSRLSPSSPGIVPDEAQRSERIKEKTLGGDWRMAIDSIGEEMAMTLWGALIVLLAIFFALRRLMKNLIGGRSAPGGVYVRKPFLTDGERAFLSQLQGFMPDGDSVMAKVRVVDLVEVNPKQTIDATMRLRFLKPLAHGHADFVWLDPQLRVKAVIMLDESTHQFKKRLRLDKPFNQVMVQAGIRVLRVNSFTDFTEQATHCDAL